MNGSATGNGEKPLDEGLDFCVPRKACAAQCAETVADGCKARRTRLVWPRQGFPDRSKRSDPGSPARILKLCIRKNTGLAAGGSMSSIVIAQGGGPTAVINQTLCGAIVAARRHDPSLRILGARHGVRGLTHGDLVDLAQLSEADLLRLARTPNSGLGSTRDKPDPAYSRPSWPPSPKPMPGPSSISAATTRPVRWNCCASNPRGHAASCMRPRRSTTT